MSTPSLSSADSRLTAPKGRRPALVAFCAIFFASLAGVSAHIVKGLESPDLANAFVSSPSTGNDPPIPVAWGGENTGLRVVCFNVANTSPERVDRPSWPRITGVGLELPGSVSGFALMMPLDGDWELVEGARASLRPRGKVTLDLAILAREKSKKRGLAPHGPRGIPPGQPGERGSGTRFCVSGPFPDRLPDPSTADTEDTVATTIERLLDGVVVEFHGVAGNHRGTDMGVWFPPPGTDPRVIPLFP